MTCQGWTAATSRPLFASMSTPLRNVRVPKRGCTWAPNPAIMRPSVGQGSRPRSVPNPTAGGVTVAVLEKLARSGAIDPGERVVAYITGEGLKTLDATRESFRMHEIDPSLESFESELQPEQVA